MPTIITAKNGDCLCGIASDFGFFNCQPIRDLGENAAFLNRELIAGDEITVPDLFVEDFLKAIDTKHTFKVKTSPPINIRYVHGSPTLPYRDDSTTLVLNVSNFVTNLGGATGLRPFPTATGPNAGFGFNDDGHQDLDAFKVEVWDPAAGGSVNVKLEALKPVYTADPLTGVLTATSFVEFGDAQRRIDALECKVVSSGTDNTYRSRYMRLVVDEVDRDEPSVAGQVLFVSDMADGLGSGAAADNDTVEILDQLVRATYEVQRCPGSPKCRVSVVAPIGGDERQRVRLHFTIFRQTPGDANMLPGVPIDTVKQHVRFRTFKWYRRLFAQINISPRLAAITVLDPPAESMLCLSHSHGNAAIAGTTLSFDVETESGLPIPVPLPLVAGETPLETGNRINAALPPGFSSQAFPTPLATGRANPACDVVITAANGERVTISNEAVDLPGGISVEVPRPAVTSVKSAPVDGSNSFLTPEIKRYLRASPVAIDALHCIVIGRFANETPLGRAFIHNFSTDPSLQPAAPYCSATLIAHSHTAGGILDGGNTFPTVSTHESTHILSDLSHALGGTPNAANQLMAPTANPTLPVGGPKRICDGPFLVTMQRIGFATTVTIKLADAIRTAGTTKLEPW